MDFVSQLATLVVGLLLGIFCDRLALRRERDRDRIARCREAADLLLPHLRHLRALARDSEIDDAHPRAWSEAVTGLARAYDDIGHRLPDEWHHLHRSVRGAVGEFAGGVAMSDLDKRMVDYPLPPHDHEWLTNALEYLDYAISQLQHWRDDPSPRRGQDQHLRAFDPWLAARR